MTDKLQESILIAKYGSATKELTDLVMAAEKAYNDYGKRTIFGRDKGQEADDLLGKAVVRAATRLTELGLVSSSDLRIQVDALKAAIRQTQAAYPNWPKAYRHLETWLDDFLKPVDLSPVVARKMEEVRRRRGN
jgi:hypothetical protein